MNKVFIFCYYGLNDDLARSKRKDNLDKDLSMNDMTKGKLPNITFFTPIGNFVHYFNDNSMEELWMVLTWGKQD